MESTTTTPITVETTVNAPLGKVWDSWVLPEHITKWCQASEDWHAPYAENDLKTGGRFKTTMAAKDGSFSFDFGGTYTKVETLKVIEYTMDDNRKAWLKFEERENGTHITETFEPESINPPELQKGGWQAILNSFKAYTESK
ncbi:MAG: SRPBCC domain-containing protein [Cytophagales bacterium]|nr:SRPBCC domain-containing protein [Cytophagales bacterium]